PGRLRPGLSVGAPNIVVSGQEGVRQQPSTEVTPMAVDNRESPASNGIATAADFRRAAEVRAFEPAERVVLPKSGLAVILRRPKPVAFTFFTARLPSSLAARVQAGGAGSDPASVEDLVALSRFWTGVFEQMFVQPKLSLMPGPHEIHPTWIPNEDANFLIRWAVGEVTSDGLQAGSGGEGSVDLAPFRPHREPPVAGASGGDLALPPEPAPLGQRDSLST